MRRNRWIQLGLVVFVCSLAVRAEAAAFTWDGSLASDNWDAVEGGIPLDTNCDRLAAIPGVADGIRQPH